MNKGCHRGLGSGMLLRGADTADLLPSQPLGFPYSETSKWRQHQAGNSSQLAGVQNTLYTAAFWIPPGSQICGIGVRVSTAVASTTARFGIYAEEGKGIPESLIYDTQLALAAGTTGFKSTPLYIGEQGWVWLAVALQGASGPNVDFTANANGSDFIGGAAPATTTPVGFSQASISGALPSPWGPTVTEAGRVPMFWLDVRPTD